MVFGWLFGKKKVDELEDSTKKGFEEVKKDIQSVSGWIKHLDSEKNLQQKDISDLKEDLSTIKTEIEGLKNAMSFIGEMKTNRVFKTPKRLSNKQTAVEGVQTAVQTGVQTPNLRQFSITERAIIWVLINSDMKLSYEDLAAMLGKKKSTIRGQINRIKQKSEIIEEKVEKNGKKRLYIGEKDKEKLLKKQKVRVKKNNKKKKGGKKS